MTIDRERLNQIDGAMPRLNAIPAGLRLQPALPARLRPLHASSGPTCWTPAPRAPPAGCTTRARAGVRTAVGATSRMTPQRRWSQAHDLAKTFDVSAPWLNRVLERKPRALLHAVDGVSFAIERGKTLALVGESGCGKSTVARLLVGLYEPTRGGMHFDGQDAHAAFKTPRGPRAAPAHPDDLPGPVRQPEPALDGRGHRRRAAARARPRHRQGRAARARGRAAAVGRPVRRWTWSSTRTSSPAASASASRSRARWPPQPEFLVCDEPTSALDVSVQAQVLNIMKDLQRERGLTYLFISHNLAVVRHVSDQVGVMYLGRLVELADKHAAVRRRRAIPTRACCSTRSRKMHDTGRARTPVQGEVPNPLNPPTGCTFHPRCPHANARCRAERPALQAHRRHAGGLPRGGGRPDLSATRSACCAGCS